MKTKSLVAILGAGVTFAIPLTAHAARCSDGRDSNNNLRDPTTDPNGPNSPNSPSAKPEEPKAPEECIERDIFFMPGLHSVVYQPNGTRSPFYGGGVQIAPYQWSRNNDRFGPSQGGYYFQVAILQSPDSNGAMTMFETGATASFERNASRRWLIPYFGGTAGGLTQKEIGTSGYAYPLAGAHLYWHRNLMVDAEGGYLFPFTHVDTVRGPRGQLSMRFSLW